MTELGTASQADIFDHLLTRLTDLKFRTRILEKVLRRVQEDYDGMGTISPHTLGMIRSALMVGKKKSLK